MKACCGQLLCTPFLSPAGLSRLSAPQAGVRGVSRCSEQGVSPWKHQSSCIDWVWVVLESRNRSVDNARKTAWTSPCAAETRALRVGSQPCYITESPEQPTPFAEAPPSCFPNLLFSLQVKSCAPQGTSQPCFFSRRSIKDGRALFRYTE